MGRTGHIADIRAEIGTRLLLMPAVAAAVFDDGGRLLLLHHLDDRSWGLPGGAMEPDETPATAAARELHEETGLQLTPDALIGVCGGPDHVVSYPNGDRTAYVMSVFAFPADGAEVVPDGSEVDTACWRHADDVADLPMNSSTVELVATVRAWLSAPTTSRAAQFRR